MKAKWVDCGLTWDDEDVLVNYHPPKGGGFEGSLSSPD
jgi:hypothetical protein